MEIINIITSLTSLISIIGNLTIIEIIMTTDTAATIDLAVTIVMATGYSILVLDEATVITLEIAIVSGEVTVMATVTTDINKFKRATFSLQALSNDVMPSLNRQGIFTFLYIMRCPLTTQSGHFDNSDFHHYDRIEFIC